MWKRHQILVIHGVKWEQNIIEFAKEWDLLSFAYKFKGDKTVKCFTRNDFKDKTDKSLAKKLHEILSQADVVVAHNGLSFDNKKAKARFLFHGLAPLKPLVSVDTKRVAKNEFNMNSNSLDDIGRYLGLGRKQKHPGFPMWLGCMAGDKKSFSLMAKYNKQDVVLLEQVYNALSPWMPRHPNVALLVNKTGCPKCTSKNVVKQGIRANTSGLQQQMYCKDCLGWYLTRYKK